MPLPALILAFAGAAAQPSPAGPHRFDRLFISPMGEPFIAQHGDALADWFGQADRNHDGQITSAEMQQDADRFFAALDTNHDGEIDPDETTRYETVIAPGSGAGFRLEMGVDGGGGPIGGPHRKGGGHRRGEWRGGGLGDDGAQGRARFGLLDLPEPVVAADTDFNRGVSRDEFRRAAMLRFQALDVTHQGRLALAVLESLRPPPRPHQKRDPDAPHDLDPNADTGG